MSDVDPKIQFRRIGVYIRDLEDSHKKLAGEIAQLRQSHSYRLGTALVSFAKARRLRAIPGLLRDVRRALRPKSEAAIDLPAVPGDTVLPMLLSDAYQTQSYAPPIGTQISRQFIPGPIRIVGLLGTNAQAKLRHLVIDPALPFDRYDVGWSASRASHLVVDAGSLSEFPGWKHAFTLRDPAATAEIATMLERARRFGMKTVLLEPEKLHRVPLLSKVRPLFDITLEADDLTPEFLQAKNF